MNLNKKLVNKEDLLRDVSDLDVYRCYAPNIEISVGSPIISPLRPENNPSFGFFIGENNELLFNDFKLGGGDCIKFVQLMFGDTFFEAMSRIVIDFGLQDYYFYKDMQTNGAQAPKDKLSKEDLLKQASSRYIRKKSRKWNGQDLAFWLNYGITITTLKKYNVEPISHIFVNDKIITCDNHTYCFIEHKDGVETYKIYQPYKTDYKWISSHNESVWQGWAQLPERGDTLIITKSLKDLMVIDELTGIPAVSLQAEGVKPKQHIIDELKNRFKTIFIWYDNDFDKEVNWGKKFGGQLASEFDLIEIYIPDDYKIKDPSDFAKIKGVQETMDLIDSLTSVPF